jgi:Ca-activated chloride channel family protein
VALKELTGRPRDRRELRRQAVVVLTDGDDTASRVSMEDVFGIARGHTVTVYAVTPPEGRTIDHGGRLTGPLFDLRALTRETGGRTFTPARMEDLNTVYGEIAAELRHQYWVAYAPQHAPGPFRRVSVSIVNQPALQVRTRSGYMLGKPARETPDRSRERD